MSYNQGILLGGNGENDENDENFTVSIKRFDASAKTDRTDTHSSIRFMSGWDGI
jgi:hypothetical protein